MTNKDILRCMALRKPVRAGETVFQSILEYSMQADESGQISYMAGCWNLGNPIQYVNIQDVRCEEKLPRGLPKIVWGSDVPINDAIQAMKELRPAGNDTYVYDRISAIKMCITPKGREMYYSVVLQDKKHNSMVTVSPKALRIPASVTQG